MIMSTFNFLETVLVLQLLEAPTRAHQCLLRVYAVCVPSPLLGLKELFNCEENVVEFRSVLYSSFPQGNLVSMYLYAD